ncbi:hypothetical protein C0J52_04473 [Blattella germanica]|nr:hypothetical protein C0J52_04473 [Blattella germanica]
MSKGKQFSDEERRELQGLIVNVTILNAITMSFVIYKMIFNCIVAHIIQNLGQ